MIHMDEKDEILAAIAKIQIEMGAIGRDVRTLQDNQDYVFGRLPAEVNLSARFMGSGRKVLTWFPIWFTPLIMSIVTFLMNQAAELFARLIH
jgi:hypothetical protein